MDDLPNAADRKSIRRQAKVARIAERQREDVVRSIMSTTQGRAWLWDILSSAAMFHTTFNGDALQSAFAEGRRSLGLELLSDIMRACPDSYIQAMRESNERHHSNNRDPNDPAAASERSGGSIANGGDSGAEPDSGEAPDTPDSDPGWQSPGADIYVDPGPSKA